MSAPDAPNYSIERLSEKNINHLQLLYSGVFGKKGSTEFLLKKYDTRYTGISYVGYLAFDEGKNVAAFYGVIPCYFRLHGKKIVSAQSADTMTHPDHRNKGLFKLLALKTYDLAATEGIQFVFGFPNQNSLPGFQTLQWKFTNDALQLFRMEVPSMPYAKVIARIKPLRWLYYSVLDLFFSKPENVAFFDEQFVDGVWHDDAFVGYKKYHKTFIARLCGTFVWILPDGQLKVGYVKNPEKVSPDFLKALRRLARIMGFNEILFFTTKNSGLYRALSPALPAINGYPIGYLPLGVNDLNLDEVTFEYCDVDIF